MDFNTDFIRTYAAAFAAVFGGVGIKVLERLLSKKREDFAEGNKLREELRAELVVSRKEVETWKDDATEWRAKFYAKVEEALAVRTELETLRAEFEVFKTKTESQSDEAPGT